MISKRRSTLFTDDATGTYFGTHIGGDGGDMCILSH